MVKKNEVVRQSKVTDRNSDLASDLFDAISVMENVTHLLRFYKNDLDGAENWHGLSLILGDVLDTMIEAREFVEHKQPNSQAP